MKIYMKATMRGSENGIDIQTFRIGEIYETTEELTRVFVDQLKVAEYYEEPTVEPLIIKKEVVPENKKIEEKDKVVEYIEKKKNSKKKGK